jgi:cytochrome c556
MLEKKLLSLIIVLFSISASADSATDTDLKTIMQALRSDAALVLDGLLIEDNDAIASAAAKIADHPQIPPEQVAQVATELGSEMAAFKQFDTVVHDLSLAIQSAALENDLSQAITNYQQMVSTCLACHASFRQRVSAVLNPAQDSDLPPRY